MNIKRILLLLTLTASTAFAGHAQGASAGSQRGCLSYEPVNVSLVGAISRRTFVNVSGRKEIVWILRLAKPECVDADAGSDFNVERSRVTDVQLALEPEMYAKYRRLIGKKVRATGTLFGEHTAHHFTPVLLDVTALDLMR